MLGDETSQRWVVKLSKRISTKKAKSKAPFPAVFPGIFSGDGEREMSGTGTGRRTLLKEGILLSKNLMPCLHTEMADSRNTLLRRRPHTNPNAPWAQGRGWHMTRETTSHLAGASGWGDRFQIVHLRSRGGCS